MAGKLRRKVKASKIIKETDAEKRAKERAQDDLQFAENLRTDVDSFVDYLMNTDKEGEIAGSMRADLELERTKMGLYGSEAAKNIGIEAVLASDATAELTGVKNATSEAQLNNLIQGLGVLTKSKDINTNVDLGAAKRASSVDMTKFVADESTGRAKRGAVFSTIGGVIDGAQRQIKTNLANTGQAFQRGPYIDPDDGSMYTIGAFGKKNPFEEGSNLISLNTPGGMNLYNTFRAPTSAEEAGGTQSKLTMFGV